MLFIDIILYSNIIVPSGGDWALEKIGSIYIRNAENITISNNLFTRIDGIGISINGYNRNHSIIYNEGVWIGESFITLWGDTISDNTSVLDGFGYDGTTGIQPRYINVSHNYVHELGIWYDYIMTIYYVNIKR